MYLYACIKKAWNKYTKILIGGFLVCETMGALTFFFWDFSVFKMLQRWCIMLEIITFYEYFKKQP